MIKFFLYNFLCILCLTTEGRGQDSPNESSANRESPKNVYSYSDKIPEAIAHFTSSLSPYVLLVDKADQELYLYAIAEDIQLLEQYHCSTGQEPGDKFEEGDKRTPEGIYFFTAIKERETLIAQYGEIADKYGDRAFVMNYPNLFDQIDKRNGSGIWLHATNEPNRERLPYSSEGCVVIKNEDIHELSQYIQLHETPIIIQNQIMYVSKNDQLSKDDELFQFIHMWKQDWESMNLDRYMEHYSQKFQSRKMNRAQWRSYKGMLLRQYEFINLRINTISILRGEDTAILTFEQQYESDRFSDVGMKTLYLRLEEDNWQIVREHFTSRQKSVQFSTILEAADHGR